MVPRPNLQLPQSYFKYMGPKCPTCAHNLSTVDIGFVQDFLTQDCEGLQWNYWTHLPLGCTYVLYCISNHRLAIEIDW